MSPISEFVLWVLSNAGRWFVYSNPELALFVPASPAAIPSSTQGEGIEEGVVVVVVVKDGIEMRGGKGGVEGRSEMVFPQNSGLIISLL